MTNAKGQDIIKAERQVKAIELRKEGLSTREIGKELEVSHVTIARDLQEAKHEFRSLAEEKRQEWREKVLTQMVSGLEDLHSMRETMQDWTKTGSPKHIPAAVSVIAQIDKSLKSVRELLGLDAPQRVEVLTAAQVSELRAAMVDAAEFVPEERRAAYWDFITKRIGGER